MVTLFRSQHIKYFLRLSWRDRLLLLEAIAYLSVSWLTVKVIPFRLIAPRLGQHMLESTEDIIPAEQSQNKRISWAIEKISTRIRWGRNCLVQTVAAKHMLKHRGIHSTVYLGVAHNSEQGLLGAHAWLRSGNLIVTGAPEHHYYQVISTFAEED